MVSPELPRNSRNSTELRNSRPERRHPPDQRGRNGDDGGCLRAKHLTRTRHAKQFSMNALSKRRACRLQCKRWSHGEPCDRISSIMFRYCNGVIVGTNALAFFEFKDRIRRTRSETPKSHGGQFRR